MHFELYQSAEDRNWRWRLRAGNNEIIASGEGYVDQRDAEHAIDLVRGSGNAPIQVLDA